MTGEEPIFALRIAWLLAAPTGGLLCHAFVCRLNLLPQLAWPVDRGRSVRGKRLFGDNKTFRGFVAVMVGTAVVLAVQVALAREVDACRRLGFVDYRELTWWFHGPIWGVGWTLAELPNSFAKRRIDIQPGTPGAGLVGALFTVIDLIDGVVGLLVTMHVFYAPTWQVALGFTVGMTIVHVLMGVLLVAIGVKTRVF